jgi:D-2-hydroxyacid dehydrogenase (NADP+)
MLHFNRRLGLLVRAQIDGHWIEKNTFDYPELGGQTLAVVGAGSIGSEIATRAKALGMRTLGVNRDGRPAPGFDRVVASDAVGEVLGDADHVVLCVPGLDANTRMVDADWLSGLKPGAHFYNVGRGNTVDEDALLAALNSGRIAGAGLDVTASEPLPADHPFWTHPKVLLTQHKAMNSGRYWERLTKLFANNLDRYVNGRTLVNVVHA